jgi:phosphatidylglycerophosphatase A
MNKTGKAFILFLAQGAYAGRSPIAPGTAGTLVGVLLYLGMRDLSPVLYGMLIVLFCFLGTFSAGRAEEMLGSKDNPSIVIDEIAGYLIAMFMVPPSWVAVAAAFFVFRFFDIVKPWPLHRLQDLPGGLGVMLDDIGAGIYTNIAFQIAVHYKIL